MRSRWAVLTLFLSIFAPVCLAQDRAPIPAGTILPVRLNKSISSKTAKPGQAFTARIMQDVPMPDRQRLRAGARVTGHVVSVEGPSDASSPAQISLKIDSLVAKQHIFSIRAGLRAVASPMEVEDAGLPVVGGDRGTPPSAYTTIQIGGDVVYRGGGHVERHGAIVGEPVSDGVLVQVSANPEGGCRSDVDGNGWPQALWVFSSDACGVYGYAHVSIVDAGRMNADATIVLASDKGQFEIRGGSGMLLRVRR